MWGVKIRACIDFGGAVREPPFSFSFFFFLGHAGDIKRVLQIGLASL